MDTINVLIVDKNILVRRAITTILQKHEQFRVFWLNDDFDNLERAIHQKQPDIILLSMEGVNGNGLDMLQGLQSKFKAIPVVVVSPRSESGAKAAISALRLGAIDFITKPESKNLILFAERHLKKRLIPLLTAINEIPERRNVDKQILEAFADPQKTFGNFSSEIADQPSIEIVVMGGCTGGVQALFPILNNLPADLSVPIVIVQHLPRNYTAFLAESLDAFCPITVREVQDEDKLTAGTVYIAPGGYQCEISQLGSEIIASVHRGPRENDMRPSIDVLFRSAAKIHGDKTLGVLLSGCGDDGLASAEQIVNHSGHLIVQDPRCAIAPQLPFSAITKGLTKTYCTTNEIAEQITKYATVRGSDYSTQQKEMINTGFSF